MAGLRDYLQTVYEEHERMSPDLVVQVARPKNHPLHPYVFDKPVSEAAEAYYRERARELIREVWVTYKPGDDSGTARRVRAWQAVRSEQGIVYEPAEKVAASPLLTKIVLAEMEREYRGLEDRFGHFEEFVALAQATVEKAKKPRRSKRGRTPVPA